MLILLLNDEISPAFTILPACDTRFKLFEACITGVVPVMPAGNAFMIEPPASKFRLPELDIVPALFIFSSAERLKFRLEDKFEKPGSPPGGRTDVSKAPCWFDILTALSAALVTAGLLETAYSWPALLKLPARLSEPALSMTVTP